MTSGSCLGLVGANGAGKTTALRMLTGLEPIDEGSISVLAADVVFGDMPRGISGLIEEPRFYRDLNARKNLLICQADGEKTDAQIREVLGRVGLNAPDSLRLRSYSQGMRQRLGIARVLLSGGEILVFDEPTNGLDPVGIRWFRGLVRELVGSGHTVVLSSHQLHEVQATADTYAMLHDGQIVARGEVSELSRSGCVSLEDLYFRIFDA
ncbi:MAG: ATP-binding cassette domain-containing protein [Dermatophilaceae bacterium]